MLQRIVFLLYAVTTQWLSLTYEWNDAHNTSLSTCRRELSVMYFAFKLISICIKPRDLQNHPFDHTGGTAASACLSISTAFSVLRTSISISHLLNFIKERLASISCCLENWSLKSIISWWSVRWDVRILSRVTQESSSVPSAMPLLSSGSAQHVMCNVFWQWTTPFHVTLFHHSATLSCLVFSVRIQLLIPASEIRLEDAICLFEWLQGQPTWFYGCNQVTSGNAGSCDTQLCRIILKDMMRVWRAHNNKKRKVPKKVMEGKNSAECILLRIWMWHDGQQCISIWSRWESIFQCH